MTPAGAARRTTAWVPGIEQATAGDGSLVDDSTEIRPDALADVMGPSIQRGVQGLKTHLEKTA